MKHIHSHTHKVTWQECFKLNVLGGEGTAGYITIFFWGVWLGAGVLWILWSTAAANTSSERGVYGVVAGRQAAAIGLSLA